MTLPDAEVVICVHDAVDHVRRCLASCDAHTDIRHHVILIDDGSGPACRAELRRYAASHPTVSLLRNDERLGYTRAANRGLRASRAELVVLLNSDTIVTPGWLERMLECTGSDPAIGLVGPLSNAATLQSVPERREPDGSWALNPLPPGWTPDHVARAVAAIAPRAFPRVGILNGFCFGIQRRVIETIGFFDEVAFPDGYGEEQDYGYRAARAGFALAVADHAYVYHAWTGSYDPDRRDALKHAARAALLAKHKGKRIREALETTYFDPTLRFMRERMEMILYETSPYSLVL